MDTVFKRLNAPLKIVAVNDSAFKQQDESPLALTQKYNTTLVDGTVCALHSHGEDMSTLFIVLFCITME